MAPSLPDQIELLLSYAEPVAAAILLIRLAEARLAGRYRAFTLYLACLICAILVLTNVRRDTNAYFHVFVVVESILSVTQIFVVAELFSLVTRTYPGIARSGRKFLWAALAIAVTVCALSLSFGAERHPMEQYLLIARAVAFTLLVFLGLTLAVLFWFPIPLSRNAIVYVVGYSVYFACRALTRLAGTLLGTGTIALLSTISLAIVIFCLVFWIVLLSKKGEAVSVTVGHRWEPEHGEALVRQLESINSTLLRTVRK